MASPSTKSVDSFEILTPFQSPGQQPRAVTDTSENVKVTSTSDGNTTSIHQMTSPDPFMVLASSFTAAGAGKIDPNMKGKTLFRDGPHKSFLTADPNDCHFTDTTVPPKQALSSQSDGTSKRSVVLGLHQHSDPKLSFLAETTTHPSATPEQVKQMSSAITAEQLKLLKDLLSTVSADCSNPPPRTEIVTEEDTKQATTHDSSGQFESKLDGHDLDGEQDDELPQVDNPLSQQILNGEVYGPISGVGHAVEGVFDSYFASEPIKVIVGLDNPKTYYVHKDNLAISPVLERLSRKGAVKSSMCLNLPEDDPFDFEYVVSFLYNEQLSVRPLEGNNSRLTDVYILASKYDLVEMQRQIRCALSLNSPFPSMCQMAAKVHAAGAADQAFRTLFKDHVISALQSNLKGPWFPYTLQELALSAQLDSTLALDVTEAMIKEIQKTAVKPNNDCWDEGDHDDAQPYCQTCGGNTSDHCGCGKFETWPPGSLPPPPPCCPPPPGGWNTCLRATNDVQVSYDMSVLREELLVLTNRINQMEVDKVQGNVPQAPGTQSTAGPAQWSQPAYAPPPPPQVLPQDPPVQCYTNAAPPLGQTVIAVKASSGEDCTLSFPKGATITNTAFVKHENWNSPEIWKGTYNGQHGTFPVQYVREPDNGWVQAQYQFGL